MLQAQLDWPVSVLLDLAGKHESLRARLAAWVPTMRSAVASTPPPLHPSYPLLDALRQGGVPGAPANACGQAYDG